MVDPGGFTGRVRDQQRARVGRQRLARTLGVVGVIAYNWWLIVFIQPRLLHSPSELFSDLELAGHPLAAALRLADVVSGLALLAAFVLAGTAVGGRREWQALLAFAAAGAAGGLFPEACPDSANSACRRQELTVNLPVSHYVHMAAGAAEFVAITVAIGYAVARTWRGHGLIPLTYRLLAAAVIVGYPLLGVSYLTGRLGGVAEAAFFIGFSAAALAEVVERTSMPRLSEPNSMSWAAHQRISRLRGIDFATVPWSSQTCPKGWLPVSRRTPLAFSAAFVLGIVVIAAALPGLASGAGRTAGSAHRGVPAMIAPLAVGQHLTAAQAASASATCLRYATAAGWADNGYYGGDLVTAAAVCVSESRGDPNLIVCDDSNGKITGQGDHPKFTCPEPQTVSYDRGLWQLNTATSGVSNVCAFSPLCNARAAYIASGRGTVFAPWASYDQDFYARYIDPVQMGVIALTSGTVTSAELGECLVPVRATAGAKVVVINCENISRVWSIGGGKLKMGSDCAAIATLAGTPGVVLARCGRTRSQQWAVFGRYELRNAADGKCLTDPGGSLTAGTQVRVAACANAKDQTWWLP